jgi:SSS family solute:Na+ symporter
MTMDLLFPGAIGLMMAGVLSAKMSSLAGSSVSYSALFIRNLYQPFVKPKSDRHLITVGRIAIGATLLGGVGVALFIGNLLDLFKYFISLPAIFGAAIWLGFLWRRLTKAAVIVQIFVCFTIYALVPNVFQSLEWARTRPAFLRETRARAVTITTQAVREDVEAGRAAEVGQVIRKAHTNPPEGIFFEKVARTDPRNPASPRIGIGRFHAELWVLSWLGIDFAGWTKPQLVAARFYFDALFPFLALVLFSWFTRPEPRETLDRFFARVHTPVQVTPEEEAAALAAAVANPRQFDADKIFNHADWEILKPARSDYVGFFGTWALVGVIIVMLWAMVTVR